MMFSQNGRLHHAPSVWTATAYIHTNPHSDGGKKLISIM